MQTGYFATAWSDIKNSPGWLGKLVVLSLVGLIPIFGWIVVLGYLFGWARDIAWNVHGPLPARVFGNEDGRLYGRGFFALVILFVCMLIPWALEMVWGVTTGVGISGLDRSGMGWLPFFGMSSALFSLLSLAVAVLAMAFAGVGVMRMSIYGRLAPGLQFGKLWAMMRRDPGGLVRIFAMGLLMSVVVGMVVSVASILLSILGVGVGMAVGIPFIHTNDPSALWALMPGAVILVVLISLAGGVLATMVSVFIAALVARALGYWTRQFDVPAWRGQDDPLPFEAAGAYGQPGSRQPPRP